MKKMRIGKRILDVIDQEEFIRKSEYNPEAVKELAEDTAVVKDEIVYPVMTKFSRDIVGVYDAGPLLIYSKPEDIDLSQYNSKDIIDFDNVENLRDSIEKAAKLESQERSILISTNNIYKPIVKENDTPEMALFKKAISKKNIDIENYKQRFGSDYSNDLRGLTGNSITFFKLKRFCDIFDIRCSITFEDKKNAPNPIGEKLTTCVNDTV